MERSKRFDYLMVLSPPKKVKDDVLSDKRSTKRLIGKYDSMNSIAHITINNFFNKMDYQVEPGITHWRRKIITLPSIKLTIKGYDYFESASGKTIYMKLIIEYFEKEWFNQMGDHVKKSEIVPHITIAKGLTDDQFNVLWPVFKDKGYSCSFFVDHLTILKRYTFGPDNHYYNFETLKFKNDRLFTPFIYKNRKRRSGPRGSQSGNQTFLF